MNNTSVNEERMTGIDLVKFIASVLVMMSHTGLLYSYGENLNMWFINTVFRWCVPFFFICSGFFLSKENKKFVNYILRIIGLYLIWSLVYGIYNDISIDSISLKTFFSGIIPAFWFFPSLLLGTIVCFLLNKVFPTFYVGIITFGLYIIALFGDTYSNVMPFGDLINVHIMKFHHYFFSYTTRDGIFFSTFFINIGNVLKNNEKWLPHFYIKKNVLKKVIILVLLFCMEFFEIYIAKSYYLGTDVNVLISVVPLVMVIFAFSYNFTVKKEISFLLRRLSTLIYVIHPLIITLISGKIENSVINYGVVFITTVAISFLIIQLSKVIKLFKLLY